MESEHKATMELNAKNHQHSIDQQKNVNKKLQD